MTSTEDRAFLRRVLETGFHVAVVALLVLYCFQVVRPFIQPLLWGAILAVAIHPLYQRLLRLLGGRAGLAAAGLVLLSFLLLAVPVALITSSLVESTAELAGQIHEGKVHVPPPPASVAEWPLVGERLHEAWSTASENLEAALHEAGPIVKGVVRWLVSTSAATGKGILLFALSIVIAGVLLYHGERAGVFTHTFARRLFDERGDQLVELSRASVESVTRGILGVALIQAILSGLGMVVANVPAAGLWALLVLLMAVIQLPTVLLLGPVIVYVFATASTLVAVPFAIWTIAVALSDNVLKPLLLGRGAPVPMLVIFMGAIGGFILQGVIGLFLGAVALAVGFTLFQVWFEDAL